MDPSPALFTQAGSAACPRAWRQAAQPGVLIHLKRLRPGLEKLVAVAGGAGATANGTRRPGALLAQGSRLGFAVRHLDPNRSRPPRRSNPGPTARATQTKKKGIHYGTEREVVGTSGERWCSFPATCRPVPQLIMACSN
ncbi:MAG: hypothetical protein IPP58_07430 [Holophagaceae bacterium]|uniref:Uncharacterized protein n=1 Tax=Candidatus Geothrix skivensis TaxID=2954439 RepID=A0A9D7SFA5_9BACT|nr:hypothetical protein [Candidatus Geothrix skivensis]